MGERPALIISYRAADRRILWLARGRSFGSAWTGDYRCAEASASIIARPKGSGQSIVNISAGAPPKNSLFCASPISPMYSMSSGLMSCLMTSAKYSRSTGSTLAAILRARSTS
jgi:hypothetical protein